MNEAELFSSESRKDGVYYSPSKLFTPTQRDFPTLAINGDSHRRGNPSAAMDLEEKRRLRRERQKVKKEARKQEKFAKREEEVLKQRLAPKDQKLRIIDQNILERLQAKETSSSCSSTQSNICHSSEFPSLGEIMSSSNRFPSNRSKKRNDSEVRASKDSKEVLTKNETETVLDDENIDCSALERENPSVYDSSTHSPREQGTRPEVKDSCRKSNQEDRLKNVKAADEKSGKRPKRRDPIQLDIHEILKVRETKGESHVKAKASMKQEVVKYSGNILDSDNPERKRGKQREVPKPKKPSNLKQAILQDRAKRKEASLRDQDTSTPPGDPPCEANEGELEEIPQRVENALMVEVVVLDAVPEICPNITTPDSVCKENTHVVQEVSHENGTEKAVNCSLEIKDSEEISKCTNVASQLKIHSRKFRDYCDHCLLPEIFTSTKALLEDIVKFHDRQFARSPLKATAKRRHVTGIKEVRRFLVLRRIRLLVIAPDLEPSGELDQVVAQLKELASVNGVPYVFALGRRQLGFALKKKVPVSCVGVLNYDGTEHNFHNLMSAVEKARELYKERVAQSCPDPRTSPVEESLIPKEESQKEDVNKEVVATLLAKLTDTRRKSSPSEILEVIERCPVNVSDDELQPEV